MSLTIVTNERCFDPDVKLIGDRHLGTRDRFDVSIQYDYPGKAIGCLEAARTADVLANQTDTLLIDVSYRSPYDESRQRFTDGPYNAVQDRYPQAGNEYPYSRPDKDLGLEAHPMAIAPNIVSVEFEGAQMPQTIMERFLGDVIPILRKFRTHSNCTACIAHGWIDLM